MGKVAAWRPVRRGKNDRALTRYKSHYGVNLLDPSPPTDFQPPGTVLGCRLWATSHANSDKVPLSPLSLCLCLYLAPSLSTSICLSLVFSRRLQRRHTVLVAFRLPSLSPSLTLCLPLSLHFSLFLPCSRSLSPSLWCSLSPSPVLFGRLPPLAASQGHPNPHGPEPGNICPRDICVLIESPISSLIERTIGRSSSLSPFPAAVSLAISIVFILFLFHSDSRPDRSQARSALPMTSVARSATSRR